MNNWQKNSTGVLYNTAFFEKKSFGGFNWNLSYLVIEVSNNNQTVLKKEFLFGDYKNLKLQSANYTLKWQDDSTIVVESNTFAKDVFLYCKNAKVSFSDNYFNLLPHEAVKISVYNVDKNSDKIIIKSCVDMQAE